MLQRIAVVYIAAESARSTIFFIRGILISSDQTPLFLYAKEYTEVYDKFGHSMTTGSNLFVNRKSSESCNCCRHIKQKIYAGFKLLGYLDF